MLESDGAALYREAFARGLAPDGEVTVSEWADRYRHLPEGLVAEAGPWHTSRVPYLREIMDCLSARSRVQLMVFMKASQIGGTEALNNWLGYIVDQTPAPTLIVYPTVELGRMYSRQKLDPMIEASPVLAGKVRESREKDASNTTLAKEFPGGLLKITGANSSAGLRSMAARFLLLDEIDVYPGDVDGEGDPIELARARQRTFPRRKTAMVSSPTIAGSSRIELAYEKSDQRRYNVPCPHCGTFQVLKWIGVKYERPDPDDPGDVFYACETCGAAIQEHEKTIMLAGGKWVAERPNKDDTVRGYHLSALYSPFGWFSWRDAVKQFLLAKKDPRLLQVWVNTVLGETWADKGEAPPWEDLYNRRETYAIGSVPRGVVFLTAGVDVQKDRIELEVVGWGRSHESWSIDYRVILGEVSTLAPWKQLEEVLREVWTNENGANLPLRMMAVDSGYESQTVYNWTRRQPADRVMATKGRDPYPMLVGLPGKVDILTTGKKRRRGARLWPVGVGMAKSELYSWLFHKVPTDPGEPFPPGFAHFPQYAEEYFRQLTAEHLKKGSVRGFPKFEWVKDRERNEALDCRVLARAAASVVGIDRWNEARWAHEAASVGLDTPKPAGQTPQVAASPAPASDPKPQERTEPRAAAPRQGGYFSRWRSR